MKDLQNELNAKVQKKLGRVSPLLGFLAGEHASALACLWPAPHDGFLVLPTARRHAAAMLASGLGERHALSGEGLTRLVERQKDRVIAELLVGPAYSAGFMKALAKFGETLWTEAQYRVFLDMFRSAEANLYLRHLDEIRPHMLAVMECLPRELRQTRILNSVRHRWAALDVAQAFALIARIKGAEGQAIAADRWGRAVTRERLFKMIQEDLQAERPARWSPPPVLPEIFHRIETVKELKSAALKFRNCLADYTENFASGRMAIYIWQGAPQAAVALTWNIEGWRLAEAEAAENTELEEAPLREIAEVLDAKGVRVGSSTYNMRYRLSTYANENEAQIEARSDEKISFIDLCDLGDLWN